MSYYECLGISNSSSSDEIKKAYRKKSLLFHPDKPSGDAEKFKKINEAYQTLGDEQKKRVYDLQQNGGMFRNNPGFNNNFQHNNMNDVMSMFFRDGFPGNPNINLNPKKGPNGNASFKVFYNNKPVQRKPPVIVEQVNITLEQSYTGGVVPLDINRWITVNNVKTMEKENIYVKYPRGIDNNEMILLKGKGHQLDNGAIGDVKIVFKIINDTVFIRKGVDLIYNKVISLRESLTGLEMNIDHINGKKYKVDTVNNFCIINNDSKTSLPNLGMTRENVTGKLIIHFKVEFPKTINKENRDKLKELL